MFRQIRQSRVPLCLACPLSGEGLGRNRQGISAPLIMQKTNARAGVIVEGAAPPSSNPQEAAPAPTR
eukprot:1051597-Pelagomonas_calceolata.AAC.3